MRNRANPLHYPLSPGPYPLSSKPGAHDRNRTGDLVLTKDVLYRLSYVGPIIRPQRSQHPELERVMGIEPTPSAWKAEVLPLNYTRRTVRFPSIVVRAFLPD